MNFERFAVGQHFTAGPRVVTSADITAYATLSGDRHPLHTDPAFAATTRFGSVIAHGGLGAAIAAGLWVSLGLVDDSVVAGLGEDWTWHDPIRVGDELTLGCTIVRLRLRRYGEAGVVTRYNELRDADGVLKQSGTARVLVTATPGAARDTGSDVGTLDWGRRLAEVLGEDERFGSAVAEWDGTIGVRGGEDEVHLRIYRGRIIDVTRRAPHGATFTLGAPDRIWADLLTADDARFGVRLMTGEFEVTGDPYEYLRLTKALSFLVDGARTVASSQRGTGPERQPGRGADRPTPSRWSIRPSNRPSTRRPCHDNLFRPPPRHRRSDRLRPGHPARRAPTGTPCCSSTRPARAASSGGTA